MRKLGLLFCWSAAAALAWPSLSAASPFTPGDLVVVQIGSNATGELTSAAAPVFLDEFTPTGTQVQQIAMPTAASGNQAALTISGTGMSEGQLNLSTNGQYLTLTGYNAAPGTAGVSATASSSVARVVGRVDGSGNVDTSTQLNDIFSGNNIRAAVTTDGTSFYVAGTGTSPDRGVYQVPFGSTSTATNINSSISATDVAIINNTLYTSTGTGSNPNVEQIGTAGTLPTSSASLTVLTGDATGGSPHAFVLLHEGPTGSALDTLYIVDDGGPALTKYVLSGSTWTKEGSVGAGANDYTGLTALQVGSTVELFATLQNGTANSKTGAGVNSQLVEITDPNPFTASISSLTPTVLATGSGAYAFSGVAFAPVPEPASIMLAALALAGLGLYGVRRSSKG